MLEHSGQSEILRFPNLFRLSGVANVFVPLLIAKDMTVLGTFLMTDCQVTAFLSSTKSFVKLPWQTRSSIFLFHRFRMSYFIDSFIASFAFGISRFLEYCRSNVVSGVGMKNLSFAIHS